MLPQKLAGETRDGDAQLRAGELEHRTLRPRRESLKPARQRAQPGVLERLALNHELRKPLTYPFVIPCGASADSHAMRQFGQPAHLRRMASSAGHATLETQRGHRDLPSFILRADEVLPR